MDIGVGLGLSVKVQNLAELCSQSNEVFVKVFCRLFGKLVNPQMLKLFVSKEYVLQLRIFSFTSLPRRG